MSPLLQRRRRLAVRVGPRLVGLPPDESETSAPISAPGSIAQTQVTLINLMEAVNAVEGVNDRDTDEKVKQVLRDTFSPPTPGPEMPVKRGRGRPRKYSGETVQDRERERKRVARSKANQRLAELLRHFELEVTSQILPGLKTKYGLEVNTYRELLDSERVLTKVVKEIIRDLKMIGVMKTPASDSESAGKFMTDAPSRKGKLVYSNKPDVIHGKREQQERDLSKPTGDPEHNFVLPGDLEPTTGDRRRVRPKGRGSDSDEE